MQLPNFWPEVVFTFGDIGITQTLITSLFSTILFILFVFCYKTIKSSNDRSKFVNFVEMFVEGVIKFFQEIAEDLPTFAKVYVLFLFFYILWNNLLGLVGDMFSLVVPVLHHYFRPVATDVTFNAILAVVGVFGAMIYGLVRHGFHFVERYFPFKGIGIVTMNKWWKAPLKLFDIALGLFVGLLEFIGEFVKVLSLSLRLFGNIFAGVVLLTLIVGATMSFIHVPFLFPLLIMAMETLVSFIQALVFALLVLVYFKMAHESH